MLYVYSLVRPCLHSHNQTYVHSCIKTAISFVLDVFHIHLVMKELIWEKKETPTQMNIRVS